MEGKTKQKKKKKRSLFKLINKYAQSNKIKKTEEVPMKLTHEKKKYKKINSHFIC